MAGANPEVNTPRPSRGTRVESCDFIVLIGDPDSSRLFYFAWPRVSSGSDGFYVSPLSDMSPATSDCRVCVEFSGSFYFSFIFHDIVSL